LKRVFCYFKQPTPTFLSAIMQCNHVSCQDISDT
jgi:hypothetical protein